MMRKRSDFIKREKKDETVDITFQLTKQLTLTADIFVIRNK